MLGKRYSLLNLQPKTLDERYFTDIRPNLYERHAIHYQYGVRTGRSLAEHLDSACQFVLTVSRIGNVPENIRPLLLAATAVHDLNKLDIEGRNVKKLARERDFLREQLDLACVGDLVKTDEDFELVRRLIERHSGHNATDGMRFLPEEPEINRWVAMLIGADLFDLGIPENQRIRKVENELTVAFARPCHLFKISLAEDRGYLTALLLDACEEVLNKKGLKTLAIYPDGDIFEGATFPENDLSLEIAQKWQQRINGVFGGNIEQLVRATKDGIKVDIQAIQQNPEECLVQVQALLAKKYAGYKGDKVGKDISKYAESAGDIAVESAAKIGLIPITNAQEFAISEGLKSAYLSYRKAGFSSKEVWDKIADHVGLSKEQREALEPFDAQYGRCLFAAKSATMDGVTAALQESFQMRRSTPSEEGDIEVSEELITAVSRLLNFPSQKEWQGYQELDIYINANPRKRCSLGTSSDQVEELMSPNMPPETKVQSFSNRLPGGMSAEPKRQANSLAALSYQLLNVGASFPASSKQEPLYLHFALPSGTSPELRRIWRDFLEEKAAINEGGTVTVDELQLYRDKKVFFQANKVVGAAFPKRPDFVHSTVVIPLIWGDVNSSVALLKSLRLALELSLATELGFPFVLSANLEIEPKWEIYAQVEGIPSALQPLLGKGRYKREGHDKKSNLKPSEVAEEILTRLQCIGELVIAVASLQKKDDCLYDLARAAQRPLDLYYVLLRWILREQDEPNLESSWSKIRAPLNTLLRSLMPEEHERLTEYLKEAAWIAEEAKLRGSSFRRTSQSEPFSAFISAIRSRKTHLPWDVVFASLIQEYHTRLDRIREHGVGATKYEQVKSYYQVLRKIFDEVYHYRPERLLADKKTLEAAYLFFLQEARQQLKAQSENKAETKQSEN
jgi:CRISPR-associated protein Csc3